MLNTFIKEISQNQADMIKSFAIFYLLLVVNYVGSSIFTCFQINYIKQHKWLQLLISFLLFYFFASLVSDTGKLEFTPPIEKLFYSIFYFMGFLIVMRLDMRISALVLLLIFVIYFLELNKDFYLERGTNIIDIIDQDIYRENQYWITLNWPYKIRSLKIKKDDFTIINQIETIIYYFILFLLVIGFISYGGEIHDSLKRNKHLTWIDVITDTDICILKDRKSFLHYLKVGLRLKL
jgi:phosphoglycerol transferase MdoB-like AlkP superfamily enzyme